MAVAAPTVLSMNAWVDLIEGGWKRVCAAGGGVGVYGGVT